MNESMIADKAYDSGKRSGEGLWREVQHGGGGLVWEQGQGAGGGETENGVGEK